MVYPFLLKLSVSAKSEVDANETNIVSRYFLMRLRSFEKFNERRYGRVGRKGAAFLLIFINTSSRNASG